MIVRSRRFYCIAIACVAILLCLPGVAGAVEGAPGVVSGVVRNATTGVPLEGIQVRVYDAEDAWDGDTAPPSLDTTLTLADGGYSMSGLPTDKLLIVAFVDLGATYRDALFPLQGFHVTDGTAYYVDGIPSIDGYMLPLTTLKAKRTQRVSDDDRYSTAIAISKTNFSGADTAIITSGEAFADALAAAPLAGTYDAPLLLTRPTKLPTGLVTELKRLGVTKIFIVGGTSSVTKDVVKQLDDAGLPHPERIAGPTRYDTASLVARRVYDLAKSDPLRNVEPFIARGDVFSDALSLSPFAYMERRPVLLTDPNRLPNATAAAWTYMTADSSSNVAIIVGGTASVPKAVLEDLANTVGWGPGLAYVRLSGATRYETSREVVKFYRTVMFDIKGFDLMAVASGEKFPDALAGGAACGHQYGALVLTPGGSLHSAAKSELAISGPYTMALECFGGPATVASKTITAANTALGTSVYDINAGTSRVSLPASVTAVNSYSPTLRVLTASDPGQGAVRDVSTGVRSPVRSADLADVPMEYIAR